MIQDNVVSQKLSYQPISDPHFEAMLVFISVHVVTTITLLLIMIVLTTDNLSSQSTGREPE